MALAELEYWSNYPQAGGVRLGALYPLASCTMTEAIDGSDECQLSGPDSVLRVVTRGMVIRATDAVGRLREHRIRSRKRTLGDGMRTLIGISPRDELGRVGPITQTVGGVTSIDIAGSRTITGWWTDIVQPFLAAKGYSWFILGTVSYTAPVIIPASTTGYSPLSWLRQVETLTGIETRVRRVSDTQYAIDFLTAIGSTAPIIGVATSRNLVELAETEEDDGQVSAVMPLGDTVDGKRATLGENAWKLGTIPGSAPYWVPLTDPDGGAGPIAFDSQFGTGSTSQGAYLLLKDATVLQVQDSRASDNAVLLSATTGLTAGDLVQFVKDSSATRLLELTNPALTVRNAKVGDFTGRGERNLVRDGVFSAWTDIQTPTFWTARSSAWLQRYPRTNPTTLSCSATRLGTPDSGVTWNSITITGAPANFIFYRDDYLVLGATQARVRAAAQMNGSGTGTVLIDAASLASGTLACSLWSTILTRPTAFPNDGTTNDLLRFGEFSTIGSAGFGGSGFGMGTPSGQLDANLLHAEALIYKVKYVAGLSAVYAAAAFTCISNSASVSNLDSGGSPTDDPSLIYTRKLPGIVIHKNGVNTATGYAIASTTLPANSTAHYSLACSTTISADTQIMLRCFPAASTGNGVTTYLRWATVWLASSTNPGPISDSAKGNLLWQRANRELVARVLSVRSLTVTLRELATVVGYVPAAESITLGGTLTLDDLGISVRVVAVTFDLLDPQNTRVTLDSRPPSLVRYLAERV
ncbi:MAG: phage tail protein [Gemmatimonadaceae bacterium]|nr:phage tail protein [Gemmatimonadaceae bacterium]